MPTSEDKCIYLVSKCSYIITKAHSYVIGFSLFDHLIMQTADILTLQSLLAVKGSSESFCFMASTEREGHQHIDKLAIYSDRDIILT